MVAEGLGSACDDASSLCSVTPAEMGLILLVMLWNGLIVNALASVFQVCTTIMREQENDQVT